MAAPKRPDNPSARAACRGFSLIELIMVLVIISILSAIAIPRYAEALSRYRADAAARRVVADLAYARDYARSSSRNVVVEFAIFQDLVTLNGVPDMNDAGSGWVTDLTNRPYHANLVSATFDDHSVTFDGYGDPGEGGTIRLRVGTETRTVALDAGTGKAEVQ